ncbi:pirin family protein [Aestuariimicrobium soli]|uniref:pirin family protein n=1 Tax=Aestuariimicrobium soli TaxID=2035834 RepID=UPI003EBB8CE8
MSQPIEPRLVPLGGHRAMTVRRTLPSKGRAFIGAWCFADHYGPERTAMDVAPHPHTGLQTVSWLFSGEVEHRDSLGSVALVRPGEVNLMTAGSGICHSEVSTSDDALLHGVQLWVALPEAARHVDRAFESHACPRLEVAAGVGVRLLIGSLPGFPAATTTSHSPLLGAEISLDAGARVELSIERDFEHGVLVDGGTVTVDGQPVTHGQLVHHDPGADTLRLAAGDRPATAMLLGGVPFEDEVIMWWNFLGRSHDEVEQFAREWNEVADRFGSVEGYRPHPGGLDRIPAPAMPPGRLLPTVRRGRRSSIT